MQARQHLISSGTSLQPSSHHQPKAVATTVRHTDLSRPDLSREELRRIIIEVIG